MLNMKQTQKLQKAQNSCLKLIEPNLSVANLAKLLSILRVRELVQLELLNLNTNKHMVYYLSN